MSKVNEISELKPSRGPWVVRRHSCTLHIGPLSAGGAQDRVCSIDVSPAYGEVSNARSERNATLIAAAPDLLDALVAIKALAHEKATHIHTICDQVIEQATDLAPVPMTEGRGFAVGLLGGSIELAKYILSAVAGGHMPEDEHTRPLILEAKALVFDAETPKA